MGETLKITQRSPIANGGFGPLRATYVKYFSQLKCRQNAES